MFSVTHICSSFNKNIKFMFNHTLQHFFSFRFKPVNMYYNGYATSFNTRLNSHKIYYESYKSQTKQQCQNCQTDGAASIDKK